MLRTSSTTKRGLTLIETIIYVVIFFIVSVVLVQALFNMSRVFAEVRLSRVVNHSALTALERLTREIRQANSVDEAASVFDVHPGRLVLDTASFYLTGPTLMIKEVSSTVDHPLTSSKTSVSNLVFRLISADTTTAVKVEMTIGDRKFYSTAVLRGSY